MTVRISLPDNDGGVGFMELRQLYYFLLVAQELSFMEASKKAYISQQAISKSVISLEKELEVLLFNRLPRGLSLTQYGSVFLKYAHNITASVHEAINEINNLKLNVSNTIKLAVTIGVYNFFQVSDLIKFQDINPTYRISTITHNDEKMEEWLFSEKIELGLIGAKGDISNLDYILLKQSKTLLAVHKNNPLSERRSIRMEDLKDEYFLFGSSDYYAYNQLVMACNMSGFTPDIKHQTAEITYLSKLVASNQGIFLCPDVSKEHFVHPDVRLIRIEDDPHILCMFLVTKRKKVLSEGAELLKKYILEMFSQE